MTEQQVSRAEMKQQAIAMMKQMNVFKESIKQFKNDDLISSSNGLGNFWVDDETKALIKKIEEENNILIYFVIKSSVTDGVSNFNLTDFLYVSAYKDDWVADLRDVRDGYVYSYCHNEMLPDCSELGSIAYKNVFGSLKRVF